MRIPVTFESPFERSNKTGARQLFTEELQASVSHSGAYQHNVMEAAPNSLAPTTFGNVPLRSVAPSYSVLSTHDVHQPQPQQQQHTASFVSGTLDSLRRHSLLMHYNHPSLPFLEAEFSIYFHLNRIVPITFALVMLSLSLVSAFTVGLSFSADTIWYSIIFWAVWPVTIVVMVLLRQQAQSLLLASSSNVVHGSGSGDLAHIHSAISMDNSDSRNRMRRNANIHEVCSLLALQSAALICTAVVSTKDDNQDVETTQFLQSSILSDGAIVFVMICTVSLCPVRFSRFLPNIILMNLHFFLSRPLSGFPEIVWNYLWSELMVVSVTSLLCVVTSFFMERRRRDEFEELLHLSAHAIHMSSVRERSAALLASQFEGVPRSKPAIVSKRPSAGNVLWSAKDAVAVSVGIENFAAWSSRRSPLDTVEMMMRYVIAIESTMAGTKDFISNVCISSDSSSTVAMVSSHGIGDVVDLSFRSPHECAFDFSLAEAIDDRERSADCDDEFNRKLIAPSFATVMHYLNALRKIVGATIAVQRRTENIRSQGGSWKSAASVVSSVNGDVSAFLGIRVGLGTGVLCAQLSVLGGSLTFRGRAMSDATLCRALHLPSCRAPFGESPELFVASEEFAKAATRIAHCESNSHSLSFGCATLPEGTSPLTSASPWAAVELCLECQPLLTDRTPLSTNSPRGAVNPLAVESSMSPGTTTVTASVLIVPGDVIRQQESQMSAIPFIPKFSSVMCDQQSAKGDRESSSSVTRYFSTDMSQSVMSAVNDVMINSAAHQSTVGDESDNDNLHESTDVSGRVAERLRLETRFFVLPYFTDLEVEASYQTTSRRAEWTVHRSLWLWTSGIFISAAIIGIMQLYGLTNSILDAMSPALWAIVCLALAVIACVVDIIIVEYDEELLLPADANYDLSAHNSAFSFDEGMAFLFVASYCAVIVLAPAGNVVGNGRYVWMFFLDCFLLLRPSLRSPLMMWGLDFAVSIFFFVDVNYQTRAPGRSYVYFGMILAAAHAVYMGTMRLQWDLTQRNRYSIGVHLELLEDELEKDYETLTNVITGVAPRGIAADMMKKMKNASSRRQLNRLLHPDHSTHLTTTTDDVETLHIYMHCTSVGNNSAQQTMEKECRVFRNVHFKVNKYLAASGTRIDVIKASGSYTVLAVSREVVNLADRKEQRDNNGAVMLLKAVPSILAILRSEAQIGLEYAMLLNSGPLTGAVVGNEHCSFDYYGPSATQSSTLVRHLHCGCCMATSRFVAKFAVGVDKMKDFDVLQPLQAAVLPDAPVFTSPGEAAIRSSSKPANNNRSKDSFIVNCVYISQAQFWKLSGLPRIGLHTVTFALEV